MEFSIERKEIIFFYFLFGSCFSSLGKNKLPTNKHVDVTKTHENTTKFVIFPGTYSFQTIKTASRIIAAERWRLAKRRFYLHTTSVYANTPDLWLFLFDFAKLLYGLYPYGWKSYFITAGTFCFKDGCLFVSAVLSTSLFLRYERSITRWGGNILVEFDFVFYFTTSIKNILFI